MIDIDPSMHVSLDADADSMRMAMKIIVPFHPE